MQIKPLLTLSFLSLSFLTITFAAFSIVPQVHAISTTSITITSSSRTGSGYVTVDGSDVTTPATFNWNVGDTHTIAANSPIAVVSGQSRYVYSRWSDGGVQTHTITVPSQTATYTANFQLQYHLSVSGGNGVTYSNPQPGNWYDYGASTTVSNAWTDYASNSSGTVLWLPLAEGSGATAHDFSANGNDGTIYGASWVDGKYGKALSFDGVNDYVKVPHTASLSLPESFTVSIWVKYITKTGGALLIKRGGAGTENYAIDPSVEGYFKLEIWDGTYAPLITADDKDYADGLFHHVVAVRNIVDDTLKIYVDGVLKKTGTDTTTGPITNTADLEIGTFSSYYTNSIIDEVRIYNRVLSASEIIADYNSRTAVTNWQLDGVNQNPTRQGSGMLTTSSIVMSTYHTVVFVSTSQYYLGVTGGASVSFGTASPTGDEWYDGGTSTTVSTNWVWGEVAGQNRSAVTNWQLDGVNQNPTRQGSGMLTTSSIVMSTYHTVVFVSTSQYYLMVLGGFNVGLSQMSPTGDSFYDLGSMLVVTTDCTWGLVNGNTRQNLFSYTLDGTTTNVTRADTGNFSSPAIIFKNPHKLTFNSATQCLVSFHPLDNSGTAAINPSSFQNEINDLGVISVPEFKMWLDNGTKFKIHAVIWENADVKPTNNQLYVVNAPLDETILNRVFNAKFAVTDHLGIPISNAQVFFTFANGTTIQLTTSGDEILSLGFVPIGTFHATISYLGTATEVDGDASAQIVTTGKVLASYPMFSLIGGGIITAAVGYVLVRWYRRSPPLQTRFRAYIKANWGAPFIIVFMLLLIVAAVSLSIGLSSLADTVAVSAFYALCVGVVLQLACFLKYSRKNAEATRARANVALLVEVPFPPVSRANLRLYRLGLVLARKGYGVYMVSPSFYPHSRVQGFGSDIHVVQYIGLSAFIYSSFIRLPVVFMHLIMSIIVLVGLHKREHLQVIHAWHPLAGLAAVLAGKLTGVRVFLDWTDFYSDIVRYESILLTPVAQAIEHFILGNCDRIFTVSNEMKKALVGIGASSDRIFVIPDGVDPTMFNPEIDSLMIRKRYCLDDSPTIIFHGDVKPIDGVDVLVKAFALVLKHLPNAKLFIVGGGTKYFSEVMQLVKTLGVEHSVIFTGWIPHQSVPEYIALADVGAMPLRSTLETNCYLSFKLFEYWAMGKPVVVSRVKAISNIVKDGVNGTLVEPEDVNGLAEALLGILSDGDKARRMGENARAMVEGSYNWDSLMEQEAKSYEDLCSS